MECAGLFIIIVGMKSTISSKRDIIVLIYLLIGSIIGLDLKLKNLGLFLEKKFSSGKKIQKKILKMVKMKKVLQKDFQLLQFYFAQEQCQLLDR